MKYTRPLRVNIVDHIIYADIYHEEFANFMDVVEIIMEVLDGKADPIKEVCVGLEEGKKRKELKIFLKEATRICIQFL